MASSKMNIRKAKPICFLFALVLLSSCATQGTSKIPVGMKVSTKEAVSACQFLGDIHGISSLYGVFAQSGLAKARQQAFEQAENLGANTVVWEPFSTQYGSTSAHGNAYKCP